LKRYHFTGIDSETGFYTVEDVNQDAKLNAQDRYVPKFIGRKLYGGLRNSFEYRGFGLDFLIQYVNHKGYDYLQSNRIAPSLMSNQPVQVLDRRQHEGDDALFQRYTTVSQRTSAFGSLYSLSDDQIRDASFLRLRHLALSYAVPS